ncbi:MAG: glycosyltransferase family 2 protein [Nitrospirales bacterium]|nr:glycosyltransferase [Nitrospirales bacterium]
MLPIPPMVSIIIPTYNRPDQLFSCLQAINRLTYPSNRFEVIVIDDGSRTPLDRTIEHFSHRMAITLISQRNSGPATARNRGAAEAKGEILAFTDDDCTPSTGWLQAIADAFRDAPDCGIGGKTINLLTNNLYAETSQILLDYLYEYYNQDSQAPRFFASNNLAFSRNDFLTSGGFNPTYRVPAGEDRELCDRWTAQGRRLRFAPDAVVFHAHLLNGRTLWRQHFNYGKGAFFFHHMKVRPEWEPLTFYLKLVIYPFSLFSWKRAIVVAPLLIITQVANTCGYFMEWSRALMGRVD